MKTKKLVLEENQEIKTVINAVINRIGLESVEDINNHGIDCGYSGFIYYTDTHKFAMRHRNTIISMLQEEADSLDQEIVEMVSHFGVFRNSPMDNEDKMDMYKYLGKGKCEQGTITNLMAWYAAETVCRLFEE